MKNVPINLSNYKIVVTEAPTMKMREKDGKQIPATNYDGSMQFIVSLFIKPIPQPGERTGKGEEIRVTLTADPGEGFEEETRVELISATVSAYSMRTDDGREMSGLSFRALGLKPVTPAAAPMAA